MKKPNGKQVLIVSYIVFACLVSCIGAAMSTPTKDLTLPTDTKEDQTDTAIDNTTPCDNDATAHYILRETEGKIGVYTPNNTLIHILDIPVLSLPTADRRMLAEGISISSEQELNEIIQDYGG